MTRKEAIEMLKSMNQALDIAIASLEIDEKYDLEFEEQYKTEDDNVDLIGYRKILIKEGD